MNMKETSRPSLDQQNAPQREAISQQIKEERRELLQDWIREDLIPKLMIEIESQLEVSTNQIQRREKSEIAIVAQEILHDLADMTAAEIEPLVTGLAKEIEASNKARTVQIQSLGEIQREIEISRQEQEKQALMARKTQNELGPLMAEVKSLVKSASEIHQGYYKNFPRRIYQHLVLAVSAMAIGVALSTSLVLWKLQPAHNTILNSDRWETFTKPMSLEQKKELEDKIDKIMRERDQPTQLK
jgi:hypothetical protein